jgi:hypothetical protein
LIGIWIAPWRGRDIPLQVINNSYEPAENNPSEIRVDNDPVPAEKIAVIFGWEKKQQIERISKKNEEKIEVANWIKPLGYVIIAEGKKMYFFKNTKTDKVLQLTEDNIDKGWKLIKKENEHFLLESEGKKYIIENK